MQRKKLVLVIAAGCIVLLAVAAWFLLDVNRYRGVVQTRLEQQLNRQVTLGDMSLGLLPLRFQVANPVIAEDPVFGGQSPFVQAENLDVSVSLWPLLSGDVQVQSLELRRPSVELIRNSQGAWNFSTLGSRTEGQPAEAPSTGEPTSFTLGRLAVVDGQVAITDQQQSQPRTVYDHIDLTLLNYTPGQPFAFDLAAHIQGEGAQEIRLEGEGGPLAESPSDTPFRGTLRLNEVGIEGLRTFLNTEGLSQAAGSLTGETMISNQPGALTAAGNLRIDGASVNRVDVGYPIAIDYDLGSNISQGLLSINNATIQLGPTPVSVAGSVNTNATPADLDLSIKTGDVSIVEIARLASAFGVAFSPGADVAGRVNADVQVRGPAARPALTGTVGGRDLRISGSSIPVPVDVQTLDLRLSPSEIRSNDFTARAGMTVVNARFALRQYMSESPSIDVALKAPKATLPEIQSIARAYGSTGLDQISGQGSLNLDLRAAGPTQALDSAAVLRAVNGTINLDFSPLRVAGFDAAKELGVIGGFVASAAGQDFTDIERMTGRIVIQNGIARTDDLQIQMAIGRLSGAGTGNLVTEELNMKVSAVLSKATSDRVGSTGVAGYLSTALSNSQGELVIPMLVTGTFKQPKFSSDVSTFVQMQKERLLPSFANPREAVSGILGALTGRQQNEQTPQNNVDQPPAQQQRPQDAVKGVLEGLFGRRKAPPEEKNGK
jgi:uncharacterized protein involved in outer membrane biogenesis